MYNLLIYLYFFRTWSNQVRDGGGWPSSEIEADANFTDLVPEFEPGKPWKVNKIKYESIFI